MAYATADEMQDRIGMDELSAVADRDGDSVLEDLAVTGALDDASAEIDSYLSVRYPLPLSEIPATVIRACIDMAMYHLSGNKTTEEVEKRYKNAVAWLRDISAGKATLGNHPAETGSSGAVFSAGGRLHTRQKLNGGF
jgi:phage gp36-like protein